ncbi:MAG: response regulator [Bacteroidetes bacterium]|jgi:CheY-like chemotaxis protein|nr:response regulator [Bacteroidota bacterium]
MPIDTKISGKKIGYPVRVLIVEDSEDDTELLVRHLRKGGFNPKYRRVQSAESLRKALARREWDIVLSDHSMPGFNSLEALEIVRGRTTDVPFLLVSGHADEEITASISQHIGCAAINKSNLGQLAAAVTEKIRDARTRKSTKKKSKSKPANGSNAALGHADTYKSKKNDPSAEHNDAQNMKHMHEGSNGSIPGDRQPENGHRSITNVLIVEDELIQSILLEKLIRSLGYTIVGKATKGEQAIEMAASLNPDIITMDISLQDQVDGITATQKIQESSDIPVIYISGNSDKYNYDRAEKTNFIDFIPKPVNKEVLTASFTKAENLSMKEHQS